MRKILFILAFLILPLSGRSQHVPSPEGWVNDFAKVIDKENAGKLSSLTEEVEQKTAAEIAVVTIDSIAPYDEKEYARALFDTWKPGKKGKDNGVLVLLAVKERRWRIETGYGVEGILPDGLCGEIGRNYMVPYFKEGNYGGGLYQGVRAIADVIAKDANITLSAAPVNSAETTQENQYSSEGPTGRKILFLIFIVCVSFWRIWRRRRRRWRRRRRILSGSSFVFLVFFVPWW